MDDTQHSTAEKDNSLRFTTGCKSYRGQQQVLACPHTVSTHWSKGAVARLARYAGMLRSNTAGAQYPSDVAQLQLQDHLGASSTSVRGAAARLTAKTLLCRAYNTTQRTRSQGEGWGHITTEEFCTVL
jgi:hypothetical protein